MIELTWTGKNDILISELNNFKKINPEILNNLEIIEEETITLNNSDTENLLIQSENLIALKFLERNFKDKIKFIYLDPPYNTSNKHSYNDAFKSEEWLTFMKNRLEICKNLLKEDGTICVQIDDYELARLKLVLDEIFDAKNFQANIIWKRISGGKNDSKKIIPQTDYILVYSKNYRKWKFNKFPRDEKSNKKYCISDVFDGIDENGKIYGRGPFNPDNYTTSMRNDGKYKITNPNTNEIFEPPLNGSWLFSEETHIQNLKENKVYFGKDGSGRPKIKRFLNSVGLLGVRNLWIDDDINTSSAKKEIKKMFPNDKDLFTTPKPEKLMQRLIHIFSNEGDFVLDVFGGTGTTAAVSLKMNRKFILCEQMDYIKTITYERLKNVVAGDDIGISENTSLDKTQKKRWNGGGNFKFIKLKYNLEEDISNENNI